MQRKTQLMPVNNNNDSKFKSIMVYDPKAKQKRKVFGEISTNTIGGKYLPAVRKGSILALKQFPISNEVENQGQAFKKALKDSLKSTKTMVDIDKDYIGNIFYVSKYAPYIYRYHRKLEDLYKIKNDFLAQYNFTERHRSILVDWLVEASCQFSLKSETLHLTIKLTDYSLYKKVPVTLKSFQLFGATCMFITSKYEELYPGMTSDFVYISDNSYKEVDVINMERTILSTIDYSLNFPTTVTFLRRYSLAGRTNQLRYSISKYLADVTLMTYDLTRVKPSKIASACVFIAICIENKTINPLFWSNTLNYYTGYSLEDIRFVIIKIVHYVLKPKYPDLNNIIKKYMTTEMMQVSIMMKNKQIVNILNKLGNYSW